MLSHNLFIKADFIIFGSVDQELCSLKIVDGILKTDWFFSKGTIENVLFLEVGILPSSRP